MAGVPQILDVRDDLRRAQDATEADIEDDVEQVRELLDEYAARSRGTDEGRLDEISEILLRLQEQCSDEAAEHFQSARNRVQIFRDSLSGSGDDVAVISTQRVSTETDPAFEVTIANNTDEEIRGDAVVTFYDTEGSDLDTVTSETTTFEAGEQEPIRVHAAPPERTDRYTVSFERA